MPGEPSSEQVADKGLGVFSLFCRDELGVCDDEIAGTSLVERKRELPVVEVFRVLPKLGGGAQYHLCDCIKKIRIGDKCDFLEFDRLVGV